MSDDGYKQRDFDTRYEVTPEGHPVSIYVDAENVTDAIEEAWSLLDPPEFDLTDLHAFEMGEDPASELTHENDISWPTDVETVPCEAVDLEQDEYVEVEYYLPPFAESGSFTINTHQELGVVENLSKRRAKQRAIDIADRLGVPIVATVAER